MAGIGTALKILFTQRPLEQLRLSRSEVVSLFNVLDRFNSFTNNNKIFITTTSDFQVAYKQFKISKILRYLLNSYMYFQ